MTLSIADREQLRSTARDLLRQRSSPDQVRAAVASRVGFDRDLWDQMVSLGWTSIHVAERDGGAGGTYSDLGVVLHEVGRAIAPSPLLANVLASTALGIAAERGMARELLAALAAGGSVATVAVANPDGSCDPDRLAVAWRPSAGAFRLTGSAGFVLDADVADVIIVAAADPSAGPGVFAVDTRSRGVTVRATPAVDRTRRLFSVSFDDVAIDPDRMLCEPGPDARLLLERLLSIGVIATACDSVGAAEMSLERTAAYAAERTQFGRPIGSFQAVKHHCSNMAIAVEASRSAVAAALVAYDEDPGRAVREAQITASFVGPACSHACALALLVHGGIGFTWEHDAHLFLKRVKLAEVLFGTPTWHRRRLADDVFNQFDHS